MQVCKNHCEALQGSKCDGHGKRATIFATSTQQGYATALNTILPMPSPLIEQIDAREQHDIDTALTLSLEPVSASNFTFPESTSYTSRSHTYHSLAASGSGGPTTATPFMPRSSSMDSLDIPNEWLQHPDSPNRHLSPSHNRSLSYSPENSPLAALIPLQPTPTPPIQVPLHQSVETHEDRMAKCVLETRKTTREPQSTAITGPVPSLNARLSHQMTGTWLEQHNEHMEAQVCAIQDQARQKAFGLRGQCQFQLKLFRDVQIHLPPL